MQTTDTPIERAALGAIFRARGAKDHLVNLLAEHDFADPLCRQVYRGMVAAKLLGHALDFATVGSAMKAAGSSDAALSAMTELTTGLVGGAAERYVDQVREVSVARRLSAIDLPRLVSDGETAGEAISAVRAALLALDAERPRVALTSAPELAKATMARMEAAREAHEQGGDRLRGLSTGIYKLDRALCGLRPGGLYILAGRPGNGKTAFAVNLAMHAALRERVNVLVHSLEMTAAELGDRIAGSEGRIDTKRIATGSLERDEQHRMGQALSRVASSGLWVDDRSGQRIDEIAATARRLHGEHPLSLVVIDYLQLAKGTRTRRGESREQEVAEIARGSKELARMLGCPVLGLAQLNRDLEKRADPKDKRPRMSDLRESGALENEADAVLAVHQPSKYDESASTNTAEILILKHRHGDCGIATVRWSPECVRFDNLAEGV